MARKAKNLQELQTMFDENDIDFSKVKDITMTTMQAIPLQNWI